MTNFTGHPTIGLEVIQRQCVLVLFDHLNNTIDQVAQTWETLDEEMADHMSLDFVPTVVEHIETKNFISGHKPSLINSPIDDFPNVAVICDMVAPSAMNRGLDHFNSYMETLAVEIMVRSSTDEEEVNRRVHRTLDAVHVTLMANRTLKGVVQQTQEQPTAFIGGVNRREASRDASYGKVWWWQGASLSYPVQKEALLPSGNGVPLFAGLDIDQP